MSGGSYDDGSVPVPSKDPGAVLPWEREGWEAAYERDGDPLGEGGWGIVRPVVHRGSGERCALKHPSREDAEVRARFKREIEVQRKVQHRHVMPILEHDPEHRWFTMPLMDGTLLAAARGMLDEEVARVVLQIASGLGAAHDLGYVHRDVKPSNIFWRSRGRLEPADWIIGDFGVVRRPEGESTSLRTRTAMGTLGFMAPEAVLGEFGRVSLLADVYSLGRTLAWMTTGIRPEGIVPLEARAPWTELAARMTEFEPARRPAGMADVIAGVEAVLAALRRERAQAWGQPVTPSTALAPAEEIVLATVFDLAREPDEEGGEIRVGWHDLSRELSSNRANLRIWLRRLVDLGYLRTGWHAAGKERMRIFTPTELAWEWAKQNEPRVSAILMPPPPPEDPADDAALDDDIPY
jgi:serine/threonine protein kinase